MEERKRKYGQMEGDKERVCVMGGAGYIASWLIMRLLENGYLVNTTVRSEPEHKEDSSFLASLPGATQNLKVFNANLSNPESFNAAIEGCTAVFHLAPTIDYDKRESEEIVTKRSIDATLGILRACQNIRTVKRVVYTASASAVAYSGKDVDVVDESFWSNPDCIRVRMQAGASYAISKLLTERAALEFAEQNGMDCVTILPSYVVGPFICPQLPGSVYVALAILFGNKDIVEYPVHTVHVDDVARAFIFLLEHFNPKGRYICSSEVVNIERIFEFLSEKYPKLEIPTLDSLKEIRCCKHFEISSKKLMDAGFKFKYGFNEMYDGVIQCCKEKGYL
ncbi:Dihydroflavonol 4-reductase-like protein [Quillaja saponaria]|uniref:Dihydroflavonol 4-reductase-like protein n=1 Tax=Quillaja saponaria TaxID=32244 RepID=A0AAD7L5D0_QUISA|nr:Dihydroflavonol 4-reductase-like protein [Quillaja saponaria]